jgi:cholest-4-en-3-one 26-monooxygenase
MTTVASTFNPHLDDPDTFVEAVPHEAFTWLRRNAPVYRQEMPSGDHFWALTKYHDMTYASQHPQIFSSARGTNIDDAQGGAELMMVNLDPPQHTKLRGLVNAGFTPKIIRALEPHIREVTTDILDKAFERGDCDFVTDVAAELPLQVIAELVGIPYEDRQAIFNWSNRMIGFDDPEYGTTIEGAKEAAEEMFMYADQLAQKRLEKRRDDIVSILVNAEVDGEKLTTMEFDFFFLLLTVAGNETTRNLISGGMLALMEHPDQFAKLRADHSIMPTAVEEMLRWVTPVMYFRRTVMEDTEVRGQPLQAGEKITLWYGSGNRDEDVFPDSQTFDIMRDPNPHITFGAGGPHFCLGYSLARLEIRVMFEELLRRVGSIEQTGPVSRMRSNFINGIKHIPVRMTAA